ncbi:hypothetical protein SAMN05216188_101528 [Lentzea xinjiangensis]|uniref:Uncharacterized protein n=1 Tax=Lentzea xinjiangensis TaxID=402600 RepID=A0A1H9ATH0_9PSEU|nr:hypothetical protein [Lentzea xinjiangensis]SEP80010.1 hypothetical protein SAMN05216188_101528 [Lentzea xinjiangensis]
MRFPNGWIGGTALVVGPVLLLVGTLLRSPFNFFFPDQLRAVAEHPQLMKAAYTAFLAGNVVMWAAVACLVQRIGRERPRWAAWAGVLVTVGLFGRVFHAGVDHAAFTATGHLGVNGATELVAAGYGALHLFSFLSFTIVFGWFVLAAGAYRSGVLGPVRAVALAAAGLLPLGVLKGTEVVSIIGTVGVCVACVPLGVHVLLQQPRPTRRNVLTAVPVAVGLGALAVLSTLG